MAAAPIQTFITDGIQQDFVYAFDVKGAFSAVIVKLRLAAESSFTQKVEGVDYTHSASTKTIHFLTAPGTGELVVLRFTTRDRLVDYIHGSTLASKTLDADADRLTAVTQEIEAGVFDAMQKDPTKTYWEAQGLPSRNAAPADSVTGWVTLGQMNAAIVGAELTELTEPLVFNFTSNGVQRWQQLTGVPTITAKQCDVYVESVYQTSRQDSQKVYRILVKTDVGYPTGANGIDAVIEFEQAPPNNAKIEVKIFTGQVLGVLANGSVLSAMIADNAVGLQHLNIGAGLAQRLLVFDAAGEPVARQIGLDDLVKSGQSIPSNARAAIVHATTGISITDLLKPPAASLPMNSQKITGLGNPEADQDAVNLATLLGLLNTLKFATGTIAASAFNAGFGTSVSIAVGFQPKAVLVLGSRVSFGTVRAFWVWLPLGSFDDVHGQTGGAFINPQMRFSLESNGFKMESRDAVTDYDGNWPWFAARV